MGKLEEYEVEIRDGITVTMKLDKEQAEKADKERVRRVGRDKAPQNKAAAPRTKQA